ncbi:hypothetical protein K5R89_27120, partial [Klebsiella sp. TF21-TM]|nr:hypothetical protein [Klebsiella sp. TFW1]MBY0605693.1 hypothetical protein [Klebsiella sp. TF21-TM]
GMVCVVGRMRDLILQLSKSSIYSTKPRNPEGDKNVIVQSRDKQRRFFIISHKSGQRDNSIARFLA